MYIYIYAYILYYNNIVNLDSIYILTMLRDRDGSLTGACTYTY